MAGFTPDPGTQQTEGVLPTLTARLNTLAKSLGVTIYGISGYRTPAHSVAVGGFANDPHTKGEAEDIGVNSQTRASAASIPEAILAKFGLYRPLDPTDNPNNTEVNHIQLLPGVTPTATQTSLSNTVPSYVPKAYRGWVANAAAGTGLPASIVAAQIDDESGFDPNATSPTGAKGIAQFEPETWKSQGVKGSPYDPAAALLGYNKLMSSLLNQYNGNIRNALAAYNAGSGNLQAGYGYADAILAKAGAPRTATAGSPSSFGGTRPGGQPTGTGSGDSSDTGQAVNQVFANYEAEITAPRTAPASTFTSPRTAGWSAPFQWWWQSWSGTYAQEEQSSGS